MMVPYALRLVCICLAVFSLVNAVAGLLVWIGSRAAIRITERMRPRSAARFLFFLRLFPPSLGLAAVFVLCIPSYLWLEPQSMPERVGGVCFLLVLFAATTLSSAFARGARAFSVSRRFRRTCQRRGRVEQLAAGHLNAVIVERETPLLALAGVLRPQLLVSDGVLHALTAEELEVALQHENAHGHSRDNLKRLLLLLAPDLVPFLPGFSLLKQSWAKLSEWAADDEAVEGDSNRALALAAALLRVAAMGTTPSGSFLHTSLVASDRDLSSRVDRLLRIGPLAQKTSSRKPLLAFRAGLAMGVCIMAILAWPASLSPVHRLLELFLR